MAQKRFSRDPSEPGYFMGSGLDPDPDPNHSEGAYDTQRWAVRLGCAPNSREAFMASSHESFHALLNRSTAFGTSYFVGDQLQRARPRDPQILALFRRLHFAMLETHETYATYASIFAVCNGRIDRSLLNPYPRYLPFLDQAQHFADAMPNAIVGYQLVSSAVRAAMQSGILEQLLAREPQSWHEFEPDIADQPDYRLKRLCTPEFVATVQTHLRAWSAGTPAAVTELLAGPLAHGGSILAGIADATIDEIGMFLYGLCKDELERAGLRCLEFNGHQLQTAAVIAQCQELLPTRVPAKPLQPANPGSLLEDLVGDFADERLVINPSRPPARWSWLDEVDEQRWPEFLSGNPAVGSIAIRLQSRLVELYDFGSQEELPLDDSGVVVALRRARPSGGVELLVLREAQQLIQLAQVVADRGTLLGSCSMCVLAQPQWQRVWLPALDSLPCLTVLVDLDPFTYLRSWVEQKFALDYSLVAVTVGGRDHHVFLVYPHTSDKLLYLAPCSPAVGSALRYELREHASAGAEITEIEGLPGPGNGAHVIATLIRLLREEPWFDFRAESDT